MKTMIAPLTALALFGLAGSASAASPAYCALYAKEYARQATADSQGSLSPTHVHDRAYSKCLNMDDEPPLPSAYVDPQQDGIGGPFVEEGDGSGTPDVTTDVTMQQDVVLEPEDGAEPIEQTASIEAAQPARSKRSGARSGSGFTPGSAEWKNWCQEHFPNSFDPETGTIVPSATGKRTACK